MHIKTTLLKSGYCHQFECMAIRTGKYKLREFPSLFGLIEHPAFGLILFDTGYSQSFYEHTQRFPERLYRKIIPVHCEQNETAAGQIRELGFRNEDVKLIFISHFHADHVSGLHDFPTAKFVCSRQAYQHVAHMGRYRATLHGFVRGLLPQNFLARCSFIEDYPLVNLKPSMHPFLQGFDLIGDGGLIAIALPGHVPGQAGLLINSKARKQTFFIADACWLSTGYRDLILPHPLARLAIDNWKEYCQTLTMLHELSNRNPDVVILPSHCNETFESRVAL
jgi:glyoxylase-like metal-dependent hydrolase (beta-lactamase superfamily II)